MGQKRLLLYSFLLGFTLSGCGYAMEEIGLFKTGSIKMNVNIMEKYSEDKITFDLLKKTSLATCLNCHSSGASAMATEGDAYSLRDSILEEVGTGQMPPPAKGYQPLSACEQKLLEVWFDNKANNRSEQKVKDLVECGGGNSNNGADSQPTPAPTAAPETPVTPAPPTTPEPPPSTPSPEPIDMGKLELSYANLKSVILDKKCLQCHSSGAKRPKHPFLDSVSSIRTDKGSSEFDNIGTSGAESFLYKITVDGLTDSTMPPNRPGLERLTPAESDYLKRWIDAGLPE